ncbi:MAG: GntR family transcriptional regulator [Bacilli bacterium]
MSITKYQEVYSFLLSEIILKQEIGTSIPIEVELVEKFKFSRMTVNKAIKLLENDGYVKRVKGKGTFIVSHESNKIKNLSKLQSYSEDMKQRNMNPTTKLISYNLVTNPDSTVVRKLSLKPGQSVHKVIRVRYSGEEPISVDFSFISTEYVESINVNKLNGSLFRFYEKDLGIDIGFSDQEISAEKADNFLSDVLKVKKGTPLLVIEGVTNTITSQKFEYTKVYYVSDSYKIKIRATR